jgi:hypothetical protein
MDQSIHGEQGSADSFMVFKRIEAGMKRARPHVL